MCFNRDTKNLNLVNFIYFMIKLQVSQLVKYSLKKDSIEFTSKQKN